MPLSREVSSSAINCSLAATRYAGCLGRRGQLVDRDWCVHHQQQRLEHRAKFESSSSGAVATSMPRSRSVGISVEISSLIAVYFFRLGGCQVFVVWPFSGPRNLEHTKRF